MLRTRFYTKTASLSMAIGVLFVAWTPGPRITHAQLPAVVDLSQNAADVTVYGAKAIDRSGYRVASGDINGDGAPEMLITSPHASPLGRNGVFEIEIIWGGGSPFDSLVDLSNYEGHISRIFGSHPDDGDNSSLSCGDLDNDGCDEIVIGVPLCALGDGRAYIIFGTPDFPDTLDLAYAFEGVTRILGIDYESSWLGYSSCLCEVDADGYQDLIVSAINPYWSGGEIYVISGGDTLPDVIDLNGTPPGVTRIIEPELYAGAGKSVACKDFDEDGYGDIFIGSPGNQVTIQPGKATLLFGSPDFPDTVLLSDKFFRTIDVYPEFASGALGYKVAIEDLNRDGHEDLIVSAYAADPLGCASCGEVYVIHGSDQLPDSIYVGTLDIPITRLIGDGYNQRYGINLACADVTGDGYGDMLVASNPDPNIGSDVYKVTVVYGSWTLPDTIHLASDTTVTKILGQLSDNRFGRGLGFGELDGDEITDILIGAPRGDPLARQDAGKVYLLYGAIDPTGVISFRTPDVTLYQNYPNPFNPTTTIMYAIAKDLSVELKIFDVTGALVRTLVKEKQLANDYKVLWDGRNNLGSSVASGVYFCRLTAGSIRSTKKMVLLR